MASKIGIRTDKLVFAADIIGTFVFAVEGALAAVRANLDFFGILVLSFATALGGGIIRDLLIGASPPASIRDHRYPITAFTGGACVFFLHGFVTQVSPTIILVIDAAGLGLFAVAGAAKALDHEIHPFMAALMGTVTGVGGGTIRDIFLARIPTVLRVDIYAVAALAGATVMIIGLKRGLPRAWMMALGIVVCFTLRLLAVRYGWNLPRVAGSI